MRKSCAFVALFAGLALSGCVRSIKEAEVLTSMRDLGLAEPDARCLANRAARRLSVGQLRSLQAAAKSVGDRSASTPLPAAVLRVRNMVDTETLGIAVAIAGECLADRAVGAVP